VLRYNGRYISGIEQDHPNLMMTMVECRLVFQLFSVGNDIPDIAFGVAAFLPTHENISMTPGERLLRSNVLQQVFSTLLLLLDLVHAIAHQ
jgi:hypothetical protein